MHGPVGRQGPWRGNPLLGRRVSHDPGVEAWSRLPFLGNLFPNWATVAGGVANFFRPNPQAFFGPDVPDVRALTTGTTVTLNQGNTVGSLGTFTSNGGFTLNDAGGGLSVIGAVVDTTGNVSIRGQGAWLWQGRCRARSSRRRTLLAGGVSRPNARPCLP